MRKILLLLLFPVLAYGQSGDKNFIDQNYIEVTGSAEMEIVPDIIVIGISLSEKDGKVRTALADRESQMISKLNSMGIDTKKDLSVRDMASNFKYYFVAKADITLAKQY